MYSPPTLTHRFKVTTISNDRSVKMAGLLTNSVASITLNYLLSEIEIEILNTTDITIQHCVDDICENGIRKLTVDVIELDSKDLLAQQLIFNDLKAIHHSLRFSYTDVGIAYHCMVLKYASKDLLSGY